MRLFIDPRVDFAFKGVFARRGNEHLRLSLLNAWLQLPVPLRQIGP